MSTGKVRYGLIGCGEIAMRNLEAIQSSPEWCEVTAVQDVVEELAKDTGEKTGVPYFTRVEDLLGLDRGNIEG